jgi:hypothetical protein
MGPPPLQAPLALQVSPTLQGSLSSHSLPTATGFEHSPEVGLQVPAMWHWSCAVQVTGFAPVHAPVWHVSVCVHMLPSLHAVPLALAGFEQPVLGLHVPAVWH